jgi:DNA-binding transcriptional regulator YiaG
MSRDDTSLFDSIQDDSAPVADHTDKKEARECRQCGKSFRPRTNSKGIFCSPDCKADFRYPNREKRIFGERPDSVICIYGLIDPETKGIRYIGQSERPAERLTNHCNESTVNHRTNWIKGLLSRDLRPGLVILEMVDGDKDWCEAERRWIALGKSLGWDLTNGTEGGDGVSGLPEETRARMRKTWLGRKHRPESIAKMSEGRCGRRHSEEHKTKMSRIMKGRTIDWGDKISKAISKLTDDQVREARALLAQGVTQDRIAEKLGVNKGTISNLKRGKFYKHVL